MKVTSVDGVRVYDLSQGRAAPALLAEASRRRRRKSGAGAGAIELLQDLAFPAYSRTVSVSRDGRYVLATGGYKPHIKMFDVGEVSLKFERHVDADVVAAEILSDDFSKLCLLDEDRTLAFHAKFGHHHSVRLPHVGRALAFDRETSDLYVATASRTIYRFNLSEGRFRAPWETSQEDVGEDEGNNCVVWAQSHRLVAAGGQDGVVRLFDARSRAEAGMLALPSSATVNTSTSTGGSSTRGAAATAIAFDARGAGLRFVVGDSAGMCRVYDLRSRHALMEKEHPYCLPVQSVQFRQESSSHAESSSPSIIVSSDAKQIKGWDASTGAGKFNIECDFKVAGVCVAPVGKLDGDSSGLIFAAGDQQRVGTFFVPSLGPAPRWTSFLESLTEELEHKDQQVYDNYRFVTREELEDLNLSNLIGTAQLRPWMHGFFIDYKTFERLKAVTKPSVFEEWRRERSKEKREKKTKDRIVLREKVKVNKDLANRSGQLAQDERFQSLFQDEAFAIDEESQEYKQIYTSGRRAAMASAAERDEEEDDDDDDHHADDEEPSGTKKKLRASVPLPASSGKGAKPKVVDEEEEDQDEEEEEQTARRGKEVTKRAKNVVRVGKALSKSFLGDDDDRGEENGRGGETEEDAPMQARLQQRNKRHTRKEEEEEHQDSRAMEESVVQLPDGSLSLTYIPRTERKATRGKARE